MYISGPRIKQQLQGFIKTLKHPMRRVIVTIRRRVGWNEEI